MRLIINADDAGLDAGTDDAIMAGHAAGLIGSTSVVAGGATGTSFLRRAPSSLAVGWHMNLTEGRALSAPNPALAASDGRFRFGKAELWDRVLAGSISEAAIGREVAAQWAWWQAVARLPAHVDGHNHVHVLPAVAAALHRVVPTLGLRSGSVGERAGTGGLRPHARWSPVARDEDAAPPLLGVRFAKDPSIETFLGEVDALSRNGSPVTCAEFMVHPGARAGTAFSASPARDEETRILCDPRLRAALAERGWRTCGREAQR